MSRTKRERFRKQTVLDDIYFHAAILRPSGLVARCGVGGRVSLELIYWSKVTCPLCRGKEEVRDADPP